MLLSCGADLDIMTIQAQERRTFDIHESFVIFFSAMHTVNLLFGWIVKCSILPSSGRVRTIVGGNPGRPKKSTLSDQIWTLVTGNCAKNVIAAIESQVSARLLDKAAKRVN